MPILSSAHKIGPKWISLNITAHRQEMLVTLHWKRLETTLVQMTSAGRIVMGMPTLRMREC
jgi:hypothetical protein